MCGIAGFITDQNFYNEKCIMNLDNMIYKLKHRGPNSSGKWIYKNQLYLGHTRLSIQDLSDKANQPMISSNNRFILIFNGEIYNHLSLRYELRYEWKTLSDTETILALLENYSFEETIKKLEGMFAIVCFDQVEKKLYLARDYAGEKPLFFGWSNNVFLFASELKSITANSFFKKQLNLEAVNSFLQYSYVKSPLSIFDKLYKLPPNTILETSLDIFKCNEVKSLEINKKNNYYKIYNYEKNIQEISTKNNKTIEENIEYFHHIFKDTINKSFISDVPVGVFLSSGIDSTLTSVFAKKYTKNSFDSFTIGFNETNYDESLHASNISNYLKIKNHKHILTPILMQSVIPDIPKIYDEPFSDSSQIPTYLLSKLASSKVKVILSGDGGDELFGGYNRYIYTNKVWNYIRFIPHSLRKNIANLFISNKNFLFILTFFLKKLKFKNIDHEKLLKILSKLSSIKDKKTLYLSMLKEVNTIQINNNKLSNNFDIIFNEYIKNSSSFDEAMMSYDFDNYLNDDILVKVDRASMSNSLEVRAPFLNKNIIKFAKSLPADQKLNHNNGKIILRKILEQNIPQNLVNKSKIGFGIPLREWLKNDLNQWMNDTLSINNLNKHAIFDNTEVLNLKENINHSSINKLWSVLVFQIWYDANFK